MKRSFNTVLACLTLAAVTVVALNSGGPGKSLDGIVSSTPTLIAVAATATAVPTLSSS